MFAYSRLTIIALVVGCGTFAFAADRQEVPPQSAPVMMHGYDGIDQFTTYCASCHGTTAKGDGTVGALLRKKPPDLTTFAQRNGGTFDAELVYKIIDGRKPVQGHGGNDMPVWGDALSRSREGSSPGAIKDRIEAIVRYLQRIQVKAQ
jgi:mono/diheme cytochrome c family protein